LPPLLFLSGFTVVILWLSVSWQRHTADNKNTVTQHMDICDTEKVGHKNAPRDDPSQGGQHCTLPSLLPLFHWVTLLFWVGSAVGKSQNILFAVIPSLQKWHCVLPFSSSSLLGQALLIRCLCCLSLAGGAFSSLGRALLVVPSMLESPPWANCPPY